MPVILLVICYILLTLIFLESSLPVALLAGAVAMGTGTVFVTEILSFLKLLNYTALFSTWLLADIGLLGLCISRKRKFPSWQRPERVEKTFALMAGALFIFVLLPVACTAFKAAPGSWDSMTYHLARVEHWVQDGSLGFYPTNIERQLWKDYGGEIFVLHFRILTGADRLSNIVQLLAWFGCMVTAWAILELWQRGRIDRHSQLLGRWEKLLAVVLIATIPMSILQASSTQVDLIGSFWLMVFVYFLMVFIKSDQKSSLIFCGLALGLCLLTRETNYLYAWAFVAWLAVVKFKRESWGKVFVTLGIVLGLMLLVNAGHYARNMCFYHRILSPGGEDLINEHWTLGTLVVNALRNTFMHITTPFIAVNAWTMGFLERWTQAWGINIQDPSSMVTDRFNINALFLEEDYAQNPLHLFLLLALVLYTATRWIMVKEARKEMSAVYVLVLVAGMATFSLVLKWQPWHSRLHLGIFILSCVAAAAMIGHLHRRWVTIIVMVIFMAPSLLWVFRNDNRPLLGPLSIWRTDRHMQYFQKQAILALPNKAASEIFNKISCTQIGLVFQENSWEYPLWVLMREQEGNGLRMEHVDVINATKNLVYPRGDFIPCGLYMQPSDDRKILIVQDRVFGRIWETRLDDGSHSAVFIPVNRPPEGEH